MYVHVRGTRTSSATHMCTPTNKCAVLLVGMPPAIVIHLKNDLDLIIYYNLDLDLVAQAPSHHSSSKF